LPHLEKKTLLVGALKLFRRGRAKADKNRILFLEKLLLKK
jgi:hypothetical protein